ncbi:MAG: carbamoyl-phosphate synthase large subunit [Spirochaetales bacterium]|nr:carbamoyl-phosphate synthase large subunit [Spirochaetales bacterium]
MPARKDIKKILIIGSGPIVIGQACEFDYSGVQAVKALKEEGYEVVLVNPNPATVMTTPGIADAIYTEPLHPDYLDKILEVEKPDAILPTMGGQTALNLAMSLDKLGILAKHNVELIGASIKAIDLAEDRGQFKQICLDIGLDVPKSGIVHTLKEALELEKEIGVPLIIRPSFTLGGRGGSIANTHDEYVEYIKRALDESPTTEALVEESLIGWKEYELEVVRDFKDNAVIICSIENIDPMGVHTGDSITVAPVQTLSDKEYQRMRTAAIDILRAIGVDCGGSNVQFAVDPKSGRMIVIEMNPRVSRSSALASKATGFPIARCSAKLAVGFTLDEIMNEITGKTVSCFEPSIDYVAAKVPRFEMDKFPQGYDELGTQMKSVGEALAIGRTCIEALNKAVRSSELKFDGIEDLPLEDEQLIPMLVKQDPKRIFAAYTYLKRHGESSIDKVHQLSGFDPWFLYQLHELALVEKRLVQEKLTKELLLEAKKMGISDIRIAKLTGSEEDRIWSIRKKFNITASYHFVDTCAGEFTASTPYFYSTFDEIDEGEPLGRQKGESVIILASGPNRIGQGLEFDTSCTLAALAYEKYGVKTILVNSNPETVSTDFNISDRLYIEPLVAENVKEIMDKENVKDIVVQLGGQTPLNISEPLQRYGANIIGTSVQSIWDAEDRELFSNIIKTLKLKQPENRMAGTREAVVKCAEEVGYPVLLRPSFVLGGKNMVVAFDKDELNEFLARDIDITPKTPVLVDQFLEDAFEYDVDALCDGNNVYIGGIMQHIEAAGVHSGDSACVFPAYKTNDVVMEKMKKATVKIAREFKIKGFLNIQFAAKDDDLYVIEVNPRASRTIPFLSKASGVDLIDAAVRIWRGEKLEQQGLTEKGFGIGSCVLGWAVKEAVFSFDRFRTVDPLLGPEMRSTGEVIGTGDTFGEAFAKAQVSADNFLPTKGRAFISVHKKDRETILPIVRDLIELGFDIVATRGTAQFLYDNDILAEVVLKVHEGGPNIVDQMVAKKVDLLINTPLGVYSQKGDHMIRIEAVRRKIPYTTTTSAAEAAVEGIKYLKEKEIKIQKLKGKFI